MLAPWKKSNDKPRQHIKKQRHYFANKGLSCQSYGFSSGHVCIWELDHKEGWALKNWYFWTVLLDKALRLHWMTRISNQSGLGEINPEYSLKGLMLKLQYFGYLMQRANSLEKTLMLGKIEVRSEVDDRGWDGWMVSPTQWTWVWENFGRWWRTGNPGLLQSMGSQRVGNDWTTERQKQLIICLQIIVSYLICYITSRYM